MPNGASSHGPPAAEPTDIEIARHVLARCRELDSLAGHLENEEVSRLLRETIQRLEELLAEDA